MQKSKLPILRSIAWLVYGIMIVMSSSCGHGDASLYASLEKADSLMEISSDSAFIILRSVDVSDAKSEETKAYYGLLITQAKVKNNILDSLDAELIDFSVDYYRDRKPIFNRMRAYYYQAWARFMSENYRSGMNSAMAALELAEKIGDYTWLARTNETISDLMTYGRLSDDAIIYLKNAAEYYRKAGKENNYRWALGNIAVDYANMDSLEQSEAILTQLIESDLCNGYDTLRAANFTETLIGVLYDLNKLYEAKYWVKRYEKYRSFTVSGPEYYAKKAIVMMDEMSNEELTTLIDSAKALTMNDNQLLAVIKADYYLAIKNNDFKSAKDYSDSLLIIQNRIVHSVLKQSVVIGQRDYEAYKANIERIKRTRTQLGLIVFVVLGVIILAVVIYIVHLSVKIKNAEIESYMTKVLSLSKSLELSQKEQNKTSDILLLKTYQNKQLENLVEKHFRSRWVTLNNLCNAYFEKAASPKMRQTIVKDVEKEIYSILSPIMLEELERNLNETHNNIINRLRTQCPFISKEDVNFIMLLYSGFSPKAICLLTGIKLKYFYTKRSRLIDRIRKASPKDAEKFINNMSLS